MEVAGPPPQGPIPASVLADREAKRRDAAVALGRCMTGCADLDDYVLMGGFERGSVVGLSAEDDEVGLQMGLQTLAHSVCSDHGGGGVNALVVTPKPASTILVALRDAIRTELRIGGLAHDQVAAKTRECLERVMLSCVFDLDGLWEVLEDLDRSPSVPASADEALAESPKKSETEEKSAAEVEEIGDSQEDDDELLSSPEPPKPKTPPRKQPQPQPQPQQPAKSQPGIILITHFTSILTSFFTHREKSAAHSTLQLLGDRLRNLTRNLPSSPLIMLLNSTSSPSAPSATGGAAAAAAPDPTLRSIFNPPPAPPPGSRPPNVGPSSSSWRNKPSFGLVFAQLLDLHLLCTQIPRTTASSNVGDIVWVVEVLLDDMGVWQGQKGARPDREQRWTALDVQGGRFKEAFPKTDKDAGK